MCLCCIHVGAIWKYLFIQHESRKIQFKKYVALIIAFSQVYYGNIRDATAFPLLSYVFEFHALLPVYN